MRDQIMTRQALAREVALNAPGMPPEIWLQVMQQLASQRDFASLFRCARVSRSMANFSLPLLYSVHELANVDISVVLWRSVIASALGKTLFPYCTWIKVLKLSNLMSLLEDISQQKAVLRGPFFSPPLQNLKGMNRDAIIIQVADLITQRIEDAAKDADKATQLTSLEGPHLPSAYLSTFVSRLSRLTSLAVRDGSVLTIDVGQAIRKNCPAFKELMCYYCQGTDVDTELSSFIRCLPYNTLESFTVTSLNGIGEDTFQALNGHSLSLKRLGLMSLEPAAWDSIDILSTPNLESLTLEPSATARNLAPLIADKVVLWLKQCVCLKELEITSFPHTDSVLADVLQNPDIRLTSLILRRLESGATRFYEHLACQKDLRHLAIPSFDDEDDEEIIFIERHVNFVKALAEFQNLRRLITNEPFQPAEFQAIIQSNPFIEELVLNGFGRGEVFLKLLGSLPRLKSVQILSETAFSMDTFTNFFNMIEAQPEADHEGFQFYLAQQDSAYKFSDEQEAWLDNEIRRRFGGRFFISYQADPDDLHESDFSD